MIFNRLNFTYNNTADFTALAENIVFNLGCGKRKFADKFNFIKSSQKIMKSHQEKRKEAEA